MRRLCLKQAKNHVTSQRRERPRKNGRKVKLNYTIHEIGRFSKQKVDRAVVGQVKIYNSPLVLNDVYVISDIYQVISSTNEKICIHNKLKKDGIL